MSAFQLLLKMRDARVKNGKSPLAMEILRAFQYERRLHNERVAKAVENGILNEIVERTGK